MKHDYTWSITNATKEAAAEYLDECRAKFPGGKRAGARAKFFAGVMVGVILMACMNIGDLHISVCTGECDDAGVLIIGDRK